MSTDMDALGQLLTYIDDQYGETNARINELAKAVSYDHVAELVRTCKALSERMNDVKSECPHSVRNLWEQMDAALSHFKEQP